MYLHVALLRREIDRKTYNHENWSNVTCKSRHISKGIRFCNGSEITLYLLCEGRTRERLWGRQDVRGERGKERRRIQREGKRDKERRKYRTGRNEGVRREWWLEGGCRGRGFHFQLGFLSMRWSSTKVIKPLKLFTCLKIRTQIILL